MNYTTRFFFFCLLSSVSTYLLKAASAPDMLKEHAVQTLCREIEKFYQDPSRPKTGTYYTIELFVDTDTQCQCNFYDDCTHKPPILIQYSKQRPEGFIGTWDFKLYDKNFFERNFGPFLIQLVEAFEMRVSAVEYRAYAVLEPEAFLSFQERMHNKLSRYLPKKDSIKKPIVLVTIKDGPRTLFDQYIAPLLHENLVCEGDSLAGRIFRDRTESLKKTSRMIVAFFGFQIGIYLYVVIASMQ